MKNQVNQMDLTIRRYKDLKLKTQNGSISYHWSIIEQDCIKPYNIRSDGDKDDLALLSSYKVPIIDNGKLLDSQFSIGLSDFKKNIGPSLSGRVGLTSNNR